MLATESTRAVFEKEIIVVSGTMKIIVQNRCQSLLLSLNHRG